MSNNSCDFPVAFTCSSSVQKNKPRGIETTTRQYCTSRCRRAPARRRDARAPQSAPAHSRSWRKPCPLHRRGGYIIRRCWSTLLRLHRRKLLAQSLGIGTRDVELPLQRFCVSRLLLRDDGGLLLLRLLDRRSTANRIGNADNRNNEHGQHDDLMLFEPVNYLLHPIPPLQQKKTAVSCHPML